MENKYNELSQKYLYLYFCQLNIFIEEKHICENLNRNINNDSLFPASLIFSIFLAFCTVHFVYHTKSITVSLASSWPNIVSQHNRRNFLRVFKSNCSKDIAGNVKFCTF